MIVPLEELRKTPVDPFVLLGDDDRTRLLRAAETDVSILLLGETGTGKGQLARAIAERSRRPELVEVNCAALPDELLGSELFGHRKGAFTGAVSSRKGLLLAAGGKTVFLDEIGEISPGMQRMLLRVVQRSHRTIKPLGADDEVPLPPLRFLFATNRDLEADARSGRFREDLLRRIDVVSVSVPPLRSRPELIPGYCARFLEELSALHGIAVSGIARDALGLLAKHTWPGNVRELKNVLERALVTAPRERGGAAIRADDIRLVAPAPRGSPARSAEKEEFLRALDESGWNVKRTMAILGLRSRSSFYLRLHKFGIQLRRKKR